MKTLFCGGPANGRWMELLPQTMQLEVTQEPRTIYHIRAVNVFGFNLRLALADGERIDADTVLYTVLRRDVANHLLGRL